MAVQNASDVLVRAIAEHLFRDIQPVDAQSGESHGTRRSRRPSSLPLLLLRFPLVETAQKVLEDAIALFFLELSLEKDRGVRWINSVKVLLFSLSFLFYFCTVHRGVLESRIRWVLARTRRNVETLVGSTC